MDFADVSSLAKENDQVKYLFIVIEVFSRHVWVLPLKYKLHGSIIDGFKEILQLGRKPKEMRTDTGSEWKKMGKSIPRKTRNPLLRYSEYNSR
jgi:hypothetical protein